MWSSFMDSRGSHFRSFVSFCFRKSRDRTRRVEDDDRMCGVFHRLGGLYDTLPKCQDMKIIPLLVLFGTAPVQLQLYSLRSSSKLGLAQITANIHLSPDDSYSVCATLYSEHHDVIVVCPNSQQEPQERVDVHRLISGQSE
jgi:hypothetical protein